MWERVTGWGMRGMRGDIRLLALICDPRRSLAVTHCSLLPVFNTEYRIILFKAPAMALNTREGVCKTGGAGKQRNGTRGR